MAQSQIRSVNSAKNNTLLSEEYEHVPLKQRLKLLFATRNVSYNSGINLESDFKDLTPSIGEAGAGKIANEHSEPQIIETDLRQEKHAVNAEHADESIDAPAIKCSSCYSVAGVKIEKLEPETNDQFLDELDHVLLKERLRWLLASKPLELQSKMLENDNYLNTFVSPEKPRDHQEDGSGISSIVSESGHQQSLSVPGNSWDKQRNDNIMLSENIFSDYESNLGRTDLSGTTPEQDSMKLELANIKVEPNYHEFESFNATKGAKMSFSHLVSKKEVDDPDDLYEDELDHMLLRDRMKLLSSKHIPHVNNHRGSEKKTILPSTLNHNCGSSKPTQSLKVNRPRKRRKTVTDSIEIAMEEDAPGLLQVLLEKGVSLNEIKLYGEPESNDALDDSSTNDNFSELEDVISKLYTCREPLLRLGPLRCTKGEKTSYCLACLFSLVEQARYLRFRNWPVEWGWCRDLQSFIFVFERHNRIVLERPEYGYATYFFELAASLPIYWQIKRLVTSMKLTSCSRVTLLENKALMVGDDLTEGEARVLTEFGWIPNTGLGTMLNYYGRVVHDRKNEKDSSSEWSSKIGKLLMDGYNGGTILSADMPKRVIEYNAEQSLQIKVELN